MLAPQHKLGFAVLLSLSLGLKFHGQAIVVEQPESTLAKAAASLSSQGYAVEATMIGNGKLVLRRGLCRAKFRLIDPHAVAHDYYHQIMQPAAKIRYAWRGQWLERRPAILPLLEYYFKREWVRQGVVAHRSPVWIAGFSEACTAPPSAAFSAVTVPMTPTP